jgi:iron(III) transport system ATP-binding protein
VLSVRDLSKTFPARRGDATVALDRASLEVESGSFATVLGPSGSGKTTLLRCIAGFENPSDGVITLAGRTLNSPTTAPVRPHSRGIGIVPQEGALFPHLSVARNIAFGLTGTSRSARRDRVDELLDLIGLTGLGDRKPHQLSGGQQQRVALARALAPEPKLILLDEPFSALDAKLRVELREEVHQPAAACRRHRHVGHPRPVRGAGDGRPPDRDPRRNASWPPATRATSTTARPTWTPAGSSATPQCSPVRR